MAKLHGLVLVKEGGVVTWCAMQPIAANTSIPWGYEVERERSTRVNVVLDGDNLFLIRPVAVGEPIIALGNPANLMAGNAVLVSWRQIMIFDRHLWHRHLHDPRFDMRDWAAWWPLTGSQHDLWLTYVKKRRYVRSTALRWYVDLFVAAAIIHFKGILDYDLMARVCSTWAPALSTGASGELLFAVSRGNFLLSPAKSGIVDFVESVPLLLDHLARLIGEVQ
jgi:hypothetical protein